MNLRNQIDFDLVEEINQVLKKHVNNDVHKYPLAIGCSSLAVVIVNSIVSADVSETDQKAATVEVVRLIADLFNNGWDIPQNTRQ